jgi:outer membrane protein W
MGIAYSQSDFKDGYVVTQAGDTLQGSIKYNGERVNAEFCQFKRRSGSEPIERFTPGDIRSYAFQGDRVYESREINFNFKNQYFFLERVNQGKISLYYFRDNTEGQHFYIEKEGVLPLTELKVNYVQREGKRYEQKAYVNTLGYALQEAHFPASRIESIALFRNPLSTLIAEYNQLVSAAKDSLSVNQPKKNKRVMIRPGVYIGFNRSTYIFPSQPAFFIARKFGPQANLSFSFFTNFYFNYWKKSFISLQTELIYTNSKTHVEYRLNTDNLISTYQFHYVKLPVTLKVDLRNKQSAFVPFVNGGLLYGFNLSSQTNTARKYFYKTANQLFKIESQFPRMGVGMVASVGADYAINKKNVISLELRFEMLARDNFEYYYGETITQQEYEADPKKYKVVLRKDNLLFTEYNLQLLKSKINTTSIRAGFRF